LLVAGSVVEWRTWFGETMLDSGKRIELGLNVEVEQKARSDEVGLELDWRCSAVP
jgi:hypothetical protein